MGRSLQLLIEESGGKSSPHVAKQPPTNLKMKFFAILCCVGFTQAFLVRREADADPEADADAGYGYNVANVGGSISAPVCDPVSVPVKTCAPRQIEKPRQVCHEECVTHAGYGKREADAEADADADADAAYG